MKRTVMMVAIITSLNANSELFSIVNDYRNNDINSVKNKLDKQLTNQKYWEYILSNKNTDFGYYEDIKYIFIATKNNKKLKLINLDSNNIIESDALFGENQNDKFVQGDLATPIGVYDLSSKLQNLDQYYGPLAFATSYPNLYDKLNKKTGYGIWIHGLPLNGDRTEKNTKGCIAINNSLLKQYDASINYKQAILITSFENIEIVPKTTLAKILKNLFMWKEAWTKNDLDSYLSFYNADFSRFDGMRLKAFTKFKEKIFNKNENKIIVFKNISISPYPNTQNKIMYRIKFLEEYKSLSTKYQFNGTKELYISMDDGRMSILAEK